MNDDTLTVTVAAPVLNKVDLSLRDQQVRDTRYPPEDEMGVYRQPPSPEVDNAWDRISDVQAILISSEEVQRLGKDPGRTVKAPQSWGYGEDAHWAEIDVFHQIHCLNSIRQSLYRDYYVGKDNDTNPLAWGHITHCLHNLVQALMCSASADVITYNWVDGKPKPVPDFNINHKCRDFEKLLQWQNEHKLPDPKSKWEDITMPVDFVPLAPDMSGLDEEE